MPFVIQWQHNRTKRQRDVISKGMLDFELDNWPQKLLLFVNSGRLKLFAVALA